MFLDILKMMIYTYIVANISREFKKNRKKTCSSTQNIHDLNDLFMRSEACGIGGKGINFWINYDRNRNLYI